MCQEGIGDPLTRRLLQNPFDGMGVYTKSCCPYVNLSALRTRRAVAVMMRRQGGHPAATGSNCFERYATGHFYGPHCCIKTPFPISYFSSANSWNGLFGLGRARAGASSRARLRVWKACFIGSVQVQSGVSLLPSYKGRAFSANPVIHSLQYITVPRNSLTWQGVLGSGICNIVSFMA